MTSSTSIAYERLVEALRGNGSTVKANGTRATARCPAHEDHNPSLSVRAIDGQVLVHCFASCATEDVLAALGLTLSDLYDNPRGATYDYTDVNGTTVLRSVHRTPDKRFRQTVHDKSVVPLYRLAEVLKAAQDEQWVFVCEGEKDVHAMESLGVVATTAPMGATNWHKVDPTPLHGAKVALIADRDKAGDDYARAVFSSLDGMVPILRVMHAKVGKDAADHVAAGYGLADFEPHELADPTTTAGEAPSTDDETGRRLTLTSASTIKPQRVKWAWELRMALGTLALLGGREGSGKSTLAYWAAAGLTRGELPGEHFGTPQAAMVCATEDSWAHTIVPRLIAAGADLDKVYRVEVVSAEDVHVGLNLPRDIHRVEVAAAETGAAMLLLDPLMSRIDAKLDTHRDGELRQALEPISALADRTRLLVLGIIHFNKTGSTDVLDRIMGSKAFVAVARSVSVVVPDPDDESGQRRLFGTPKNNMGRTDLPSLGFTIESYELQTDDGTTSVGQVVFGAETDVTVTEAMERIGEDPDVRTQRAGAKQWLRDYLTERDGSADSGEIKSAAKAADYSVSTLHRARKDLKLVTETVPGVQPYRTLWKLPNYVSSLWGGEIDEIDGIDAGQGGRRPEGGTDIYSNYSNYFVSPREMAQTSPGAVPDPVALVQRVLGGTVTGVEKGKP